MAVLTIAGLTLTEAVRRRTLAGLLLLGLPVLGISLLLPIIRMQMSASVSAGDHDAVWFAVNYPLARSAVAALCLSAIRLLGSAAAILVACGSVSGEIESGLLAAVFSRPTPRWQILLGKWLGLNALLAGAVLVWGLSVWLSLTLQTRADLTVLIPTSLFLTLFPVTVCTLTLTLSTVARSFPCAAAALAITAFSWFDGILNAMGMSFGVPALRILANIASLAMPQGCIAWWIRDVTEPIRFDSGRGDYRFGSSPQFVKEWGMERLHLPHADALYLAAYLVSLFLIGALLLERRDV